MLRRILAVAPLLFLSAAAAAPLRRHVLDPFREILRHQGLQAQRATRQAAESDQDVQAVLPDQGHIAIVDESGGVAVPGGFDLDQKTLAFSPAGTNASAYTFSVSGSRFDSSAPASATALQLGDDDARQVPLPFSFPFYGVRYSSLFIGSDGHITFKAAEASSDPRDFVRFAVGPPRLAPLFADLDPSQPNAAVSYASSASRFLVTWKNVPLYSDTPGPSVARQTFQAAIFPDGRIEFSYNGINVSAADVVTVGIAPGGATRIDQLTFVSYTSGSTATFTTAIVQEFANTPQFDATAIPGKFYKNHEDAYDFLIIFDTATRSDVNACAFALPIRNWVHGLGLRVTSGTAISEEFDAGRAFGSASRLQNLVYMGPLSRYPADPNQLLTPGTICGNNSVMSIMGQEVGHRFLAYPRFIDPATNKPSRELLGRDFQHWSFYFNSDASVVEGNQIVDHGAGVSPRFETKEVVARYSRLDQYMMGLRAPEDVPATFLVRQPSIDFPAAHGPQPGVLFDGTRLDITLPMIIAAEGPRAPNYTVSPKQFRMAFLLIEPVGATPDPADIAKLDRYRTAWESFFAAATENTAATVTSLVKQVQLSVWPASGIVQGQTIPATVTLGAAAAAPVTITLATTGAAVTVPASVTIPAGSRSAQFPITGSAAGTVDLTAQGPDASYERARATILVRPSAAGLVIEQLDAAELAGALIVPVSNAILTGGLGANADQWLVFRVRDENFLPYPGLKLTAAASGAGSISPSTLVTDRYGRVQFNWKLDSNPGINTLTVSLDGHPEVSARSQALGIPEPVRRRDPRF
jgi:hypothetical protein